MGGNKSNFLNETDLVKAIINLYSEIEAQPSIGEVVLGALPYEEMYIALDLWIADNADSEIGKHLDNVSMEFKKYLMSETENNKYTPEYVATEIHMRMRYFINNWGSWSFGGSTEKAKPMEVLLWNINESLLRKRIYGEIDMTKWPDILADDSDALEMAFVKYLSLTDAKDINLDISIPLLRNQESYDEFMKYAMAKKSDEMKKVIEELEDLVEQRSGAPLLRKLSNPSDISKLLEAERQYFSGLGIMVDDD